MNTSQTENKTQVTVRKNTGVVYRQYKCLGNLKVICTLTGKATDTPYMRANFGDTNNADNRGT